MFTKTVTYTDYKGTERTEDFYFNFSKAELLEMEMKQDGGLDSLIKKVIDTKDVPTLIMLFKTLVLDAYGEPSADGRRFVKSPEISKAFSETEAYSDIFMELATDSKKASEFVNGIIPQSLRKQIDDDSLKKAAIEAQK